MILEYIDEIKKWSGSGEPVALARVIKTWGSSPRPVGSVMLVRNDDQMLGSVSGGCVEGAVVKQSKSLFDQPGAKKLAFGVSDEEAWSVGLSCGGSIQVFMQAVDFKQHPVWKTLVERLENNQSSILISSVEDGDNTNALLTDEGTIVGDKVDEELISKAREAYSRRTHDIVEYNGKTWFIHVFPRKPLLLIIGAAHITVDLVTLGRMYGFETVVIDPRGYFAKNVTFTTPPDQILEDYPSEVLHQFPLDAYTFCAILSHDPKIDDNALEVLLPLELGYIGALGSKKTHAKRTARLKEKGISDELIAKIKAPIGMNIDARSAREIALAVMGEIIAHKNEHLIR